jgi:hypothetical protein
VAIVVYPLDAVAGAPSYTGRMLRDTTAPLLLGATAARPLGIRSGVRPGTPTNTVTLSGLAYTIGEFAGAADVESAAEAGPYLFANNASAGGNLNAQDATNPRIDILSIQVSDPAESDGTSTPGGAFVYTAGVAAASPAQPATPARSVLLATFAVPKTGAGSPTVTWVAPTLAGGVTNVATQAALSGLSDYPGMLATVTAIPGVIFEGDGSGNWTMIGTPTFASLSARNNAITTPQLGMTVFRSDTGGIQTYFTSALVAVAGWFYTSGKTPLNQSFTLGSNFTWSATTATTVMSNTFNNLNPGLYRVVWVGTINRPAAGAGVIIPRVATVDQFSGAGMDSGFSGRTPFSFESFVTVTGSSVTVDLQFTATEAGTKTLYAGAKMLLECIQPA